MGEDQGCRMQQQSVGPRARTHRRVESVSQDGMADGQQMDPELMAAAGLRHQLHQGAVLLPRDDPESRPSASSIGTIHDGPGTADLTTKRQRDAPRFLLDPTRNAGHIALLNASFAERLLQRALGLAPGRKDQHARRVEVEAMHIVRPRPTPANA